MKDTGHLAEAERDYLLARHLFPRNQHLYVETMKASVQRGAELFDMDAVGSPPSLADWIGRQYGRHRPVVSWQRVDR